MLNGGRRLQDTGQRWTRSARSRATPLQGDRVGQELQDWFGNDYVDGQAKDAAQANGPVSYTHLTLPTICSV
eukprot:6948122-Prorocentrum_lima.AAC.1